MKPGMRWLLGALAAAGVLAGTGCGKRAAGGGEVLVLSGGTMRGAIEEIVRRYARTSSDRIVLTFGDSGELCAQISKTGRGDLFLCHDPFMPWAAERGLIAEWKPLAYLHIAIIVPKGNPRGIGGLEDLGKDGLRVGVSDAKYSTAGQILQQVLMARPYGSNVMANVVTESKGHQQRCNDVAMGMLDAAVVWDAVGAMFREKLDTISVDLTGVDAITSATYKSTDIAGTAVTLGIIKGAEQRPEVRRFYEFACTQGLGAMADVGFDTKPPAGKP